jgi:hypothetical protein
MRILFVHGRAQGGKDPDELEGIWTQTLKKGFDLAGVRWPDDLKIDFPFYGDRLDEFTTLAELPGPTDVVAKGTGQDREFEAFMQSVLDEMKRRAGIPDEDVTAEMEADSVQEKGIQNWWWVQAIARAIDRRLTDTADFVIEAFLKDVFLYVNKPPVTRGINKIVEEKLTGTPTIVVGHSLGAVVSYKVITDDLDKLDIVKYVTVGSPLGITAISSKLGLLQNPGGQNGWYNAYDERDIVALNPLDDRYFPTAPPIVNDNGVKNHTDNHHGIIGYLDDAKVARQVADALA